jgi:aspartate kinase
MYLDVLMKTILVQKFGGTSVGIPERLRSLSSIVSKSLEKYTPVVVVSAVSNGSKASGTTSLLLQAVTAASKGESFDPFLENIYSQHVRLIDEVLSDSSDSFKDQIRLELNKGKDFLNAIFVIGEASSRSIDVIASLGERMSAMVVAEVLKRNGVSASICDLSKIMLDESCSILDEAGTLGEVYDVLSVLFSEKIKSFEGTVPVVTGFFGPFPGGLLERVGRGYSDLTAALLSRGLGKDRVKELQVWKEVDGVYSADPRKVLSASVLTEISAVEAVELTFFGSEVIHPYTMEQVISVGIPIRVLNSLKPEGVGTIIIPSGGTGRSDPTAVTAKRGVVMLSISSNRMYDAKGFLASLFKILQDFDLVVDLVSTSEVTVSCTVNDARKLRKAMTSLERLGTVEIEEGRAILAVVGEGLKGHSSALGNLFASLGREGIPTEMVTQAASRTSISCVLPEEDVERALVIVHKALFEQNP